MPTIPISEAKPEYDVAIAGSGAGGGQMAYSLMAKTPRRPPLGSMARATATNPSSSLSAFTNPTFPISLPTSISISTHRTKFSTNPIKSNCRRTRKTTSKPASSRKSSGAGAGVKPGRHLAMADAKTPLCNLWLSLLQGSGLEVESHGDSTGVIDELFV